MSQSNRAGNNPEDNFALASATPLFGEKLTNLSERAGNGDDDFHAVNFNNDDEEVEEEMDPAAGRNGMWGTTLAVISTIMGGGIVSIPYAYAVGGIGCGITIQAFVIAIIWISCQLYLRSRTILRCNTNFSIIATKVLGPSSSVLLNCLVVFAVFGILALYMILFSDIAISLVGSAYPENHLFCGKAFYVCSLCLLISPIIIRKTI